jgi:hypothetical protein
VCRTNYVNGQLIFPESYMLPWTPDEADLAYSSLDTVLTVPTITLPAATDSNVSYKSVGVTQSTSFKKFGTAGALFSGSSTSFLRVSNITTSGFSGNLFCLECWFYPTTAATTQSIFSLVTPDNLEYVWVRMSTARRLVADFGNAGTSYNGGSGAESTNTVTLNTWNHVVFQYDGAGYQFFINGSRGLNYTQTGLNLPATAFQRLYIGANGINNFPQDALSGGYIDEVRFSKASRYTGTSFTVPSAAFTTDTNTVFLQHFNGTNGTSVFMAGQETPDPAVVAGIVNYNTTAEQTLLGTSGTLALTPSGGNVVSLTVTSSAALNDSEETIAVASTYTLPSGLSFAANSSTSWTVSGTSSATNYQAVLQKLVYKRLSTTTSGTSDRTLKVTATATDGGAGFAFMPLRVRAGEGPTVTLATSATLVNIQDTSIQQLLFNSTNQVTAPSGHSISSVVVSYSSISGAALELQTGYTLPSGITTSSTSTSLTITGTSTDANFTAVLRNVYYKRSASTSTEFSHTVTVTAVASNSTSSASTLTLQGIISTTPSWTLPVSTTVDLNISTQQSLLGTSASIALDSRVLPTSLVVTFASTTAASETFGMLTGYTLPVGITRSTTSSSMTFTGTVAATNYTSVLRNIVYQRTVTNVNTPFTQSVSLAVTTNDNKTSSTTFSLQGQSSVPPTVSIASSSVSVDLFSSRFQSLFSGATVANATSLTISQISVSYSSIGTTSEALLIDPTYTLPGGLSISTSTGTVTVSGSATGSTYSTVLQKIGYRRLNTTTVTAFNNLVMLTVTGSNTVTASGSVAVVAQALPYSLASSVTLDVNSSSEQLLYGAASVVTSVAAASMLIRYPSVISGSEQIALAARRLYQQEKDGDGGRGRRTRISRNEQARADGHLCLAARAWPGPGAWSWAWSGAWPGVWPGAWPW